MKVLITRAEPAATQTAHKLRKLGHEAILLPLFEVVDLGSPIPKDEYNGLIFTSRNSAEILQTREWKPDNADIPAFCVGEKTQKSVKALGFANTHVANGGGAALANLIGEMNLKGSKFLYFSTPDRSFDMESALNSYDISVDTIDTYRVNPVAPAHQQIIQAVTKVSDACVFVYSALSGKHLAHILETINLTSMLKDCTLIGISRQAVEPLEHIDWKEVLISSQPDEIQMIALLN